ncbi:MAG: right-handed parallel beta-helix repeat-containing protein, partial [Paludibacteraceae bacterium]|nr:right-handed parallel beta-helix repeat-containing protein [Paludibacteraceae bacterium]
MNNSIFKNNECDSIFFNVDSTAKFVNSTIENNSAKKLVYGFSQKLDVENCLFKENVSNLFYHKNVEQDNAIQLSFKNTDFISNQTLDNEVAMELSMNTGDKIDFSRVNFIGNSAKYILNDKNGNTNISKCDFFNNNVVGLLTLSNMTSTVEASSFRLNKMSNGHLIYSPDVNLTLKNNTIVSNEANGGLFSVYPSAAQVYLYNNTIISNGDYASSLVGGSLLDHAMIGNVIGEKLSNRFKENNISNNLFLKTEDVSIPDDILSNNIFTDDFSILFDGTYNSSTGLFTPELEMNEDFTPVVALKTDKLSDGTSLRFPLSETTVTTDQRGVKRLNSTSMGAYETGCPSDTILVNDTINVGEKFFEKVYTTAGSYSIFENLQNEVGCDSVVMHTLIVMPDPTRTEYYVKTNGTGDGSSWENAMDGRDFEQTIPLVPGGTTFYIAEGVYTPKGTLIKGGGGGRPLGFVANTRVNIIGGFPADAGLGATPNPKLYKTIFNGDIKGDDEVVYLKNVCGIDSVVIRNTEDNLYAVIHISSTDRDQSVRSINIQGITVEGGYYRGISCCTHFDVKVTFEKCTLTQCRQAIDCWPSDFDVKECTFTDNQKGMESYNDLSRNITIEKSTFNRNNTAVSGAYHTTISNSTFANCCRSISMYIRNNSSDVLDLKNNTFINVGDGVLLQMPYIYEGDDITGSFNMFAIGNIIDSKCTSVKITDANESDGLPTSYLMSYNVLAQSQINETIKPHIGDNNIILEDINSLHGIMDGTLKNDAFVPNLIDNGGFTPTIALKADKLPDGTSIRFPLSETTVTTDQRGVERLDPTCMGAYEMACDPDTTLANDTINVGEKFLDKVYTTVGRHDSIFETIPGEAGCNNVVMHTLIVKPDPTKFNYYVKTKRHGTGDGSSWENAMDGTDFATYLPLAPDGATFYVAEGTYKPVYDNSLVKTNKTYNRQYTINSDVTIRGGYPDNATGTDVPSDPKKYRTIFDGDIAGNDVVLRTDNEDGRFNISNEYAADNVYELFYIKQTKDIEVSFDGVSVIHSYDGIGSYNVTPEIRDKSILNIKNSTFENNYSNAIITYADDGEINIERSTFKGNAGGVYSGQSDVTVKNSSFEGNSPANFLIGIMNGVDSENNMVSVSIDSTSFIGNVGYIQTNGPLDIKNSIFDSNIVYSNLISTWVNNEIPNYNVNVTNTKFIHNQVPGSIIETYNGETTAYYENCIFSNNTVGSYLVRSTHSIEMNHSRLSENQVKGDIFYIYPYIHLSLNSDTIENNQSEYLVRYCASGCSIDSCKIEGNKIDQLININNRANTSTDPAIFSIKNSFITGNVIQRDSVQPLIETHMRSIDTTNIYRTEIKENVTKGGSILYENLTCVNIDECFIEGNSAYDITNFVGVAGNITNSTFSNNHVLSNVIYATVCAERYNPGTYIAVKNNTIVNNESDYSIFEGYYSDNLYYNNTILGNKAKKEFFDSFHGFEDNEDESYFIGNIVYGNTYDIEFESQQPHNISCENSIRNNILPLLVSSDPGGSQYYLFNPKNNIISDIYYEDLISDSKYVNEVTDAVNHKADIAELFQGTYDPTTGLFTPELEYIEGSFAPIVKLKSDRLPDGTSIRFPLSETTVTEDQRGVERYTSTCMGAYELKCSEIKKTLTDTVTVGDPYTFNETDLSTLTAKVGVHTHSETFQLESGCDSIVTLILAVRPQKRTGGYYVKVDGTGDGSDWVNAMSPEDFATYLPLAYDKDTFHVAEGTYRCEVEDPTFGRTYCVNKDVAIIGGYPDTVKTVGTPSIPEIFTTLLTANGKSEDHMSFYLQDVTPSFGSFNDNQPSLLRIVGQPSVALFGITFSGTNNTEDGAISLVDGATLSMDRCVVKQNLASAIYAKDANITVSNSDFSMNFSSVGSAFNVTNTKLDVRTSTIHENYSHETLGNNSEAKGAVAYLDQSSAVFANNTIAKNKAGEGAVFVSKGSELNLTNNTITGNTIEQGSAHTGSVFTFVDESSKLKLFGNIIVANGKSSVVGTATITSSDYNIFSPDFTTTKGAHDMVMKNAEVPYVLDVEEMTGYDDLCNPSLRDNGGYTPTVAVFQSSFDGGEVLSIPRESRAVDLDQRGYIRKETSCVGAFEYPTYVNYYVKTRSHGDGSGRDWANAMGDTTFARYFSIVPSNATFHVAEGLYHPMFDWTGKLVNNANVSYSTSRPINVIGSYPEDAQEGDVADATKYATILSADINGNDEYTHKDDNLSYWKYSGYMDNISRVIDITLKQSGVCRLYGLTLTGNYPMFRGSSAALGLFTSKKDIKSSLHLDSCVFTKTYAGIYSSVDTLIMKSCRFDTILSTGVNQTYRSQPYTNWTVDGCSFSSTNIAMSYTIKVGLLHIQNTTINNVLAATEVIPSWDNTDINIELYNNTISLRKGIQNLLVLPDFAKTVMKGNVFNTTFKFTSETGKEVIPVVSDYNLYTYAPDETGKVCPIGEHDLLVEPKDLVDVLDGSLEDEVFVSVDGVPSEKDITSVVKVKNDKLEDGSVIRLPLENTVVSVDEVGQERLPMTCMGAYEIRCVPDTTVSADTIFVGETFLGTTYINIGRNDSIFEILQDVAGCDSVVMHTLIVLPDPTKTNYYVRTERHGTGDGSSWKDAMDGRDFEQAIPLVPEGTTFYIAEGIYTPKGTLIKSGIIENLQGFVANTKVNIIGGFPDDADLGTPPNPKLYKTILNGDIKGDDEVVYLKNVCGIDSVVIRNTEDNLYHVIHIASAARDQGVKSINIQGITVKGGEHSGISYCTNYDVKVTFEKCTLTQCQRAIDCWPSDFDVKECTFTDNQIGVVSYNNLSYNITIEKSTFNRNNTAVSGGYHTTISNSTFANCCRSISMRIRDNSNNVLDLKNNTFINVGDGVLLPIPYIYEGDDITGSFNMFAIGNIIDSKCTSVKITGANESDRLPTSYLMSYNVLAQSQINETIKPHIGDNNIILEDINSLYGIMDGTLKNDAFVPNVIDNGGFTPTIALKADKLPDGTSIRFPLSETAVTDDQRSVERLTQTCIGAYEITDTDCEIGTILFLEDFGGNYVSDAPRRADPLPKSVNNLNYSSHLWNLGFNAYSLRKVAIKRSGSPNPEHIYTGWYAEFGDHTHESDTTRGYFMQIDFENMESTFYNYTVDNLCENTHLYFSFWGHPVNATKDGYVILSIEDPNGNTLGKEKFIIDHANNKWQQFGMPFVVPKGINSVVYRAHSGANSLGGDFALDDISIRLCKPAVNVNMPLDSICADEDYSLTASYNNIGGYIEPVNFTWYKNTERTYDLEGWEKVAEGKDITFKNLQLEDNAYYRCVISSADVPGEFNKCNSASDIIPILVKSCVVCDPDTTLLTEPDVIQVGEQFLGVTYSEMGRYDSIPENLKNIMGCDSVVLHSLVVTPAPAVKEYYVKTSRQGTGDGSSWENAMDGTDFANTLPFAPEGAAYYIAEGSYKPLCEENNCKYIINGSVSIYGGYPADAVTGALSDPKKYVTVFNGDFKGDDKVVESLDERGCRLVDVENTDDNVYDMFYASVENPLDVTLSGISVMNVNRGFVAFSGSVENEVNVNVLDCRFENCRSSAIQSESLGTIKVSNSEFSNNSNCLYVSNAIDVALKNVTMTDNYGPYLVYMSNIHEDKTANLSMESVVAKNNTSYVHFWGDIDVTQSKFDNNSCVYNLILTPNADGFSPKINVDNSEFTNNTCEAHLIYASAADVTVSNSLFEGNAMGSSLIYPYNLTVDMSSILGNKCETGNIFEVVKNAEFTNDVINDNVSISMIDYYTAADCKLLIDTCHVEANKGQLLTSGGTSNAFDARITRSDFIKNSLDEDK